VLCCLGGVWPVLAVADQGQVIEAVYPRMAERPLDGYAFQLLKAALEVSGRRYALRLTAGPLPSLRASRNLQGGEFNVMDVGAAPQMARLARIVPFPIDLGMSGYRQVLVRRDRLAALSEPRSLAELSRFSFGQGSDWIDGRLLRAAGLHVVEAEFLALFRMLEAGRFDAFPLGVDEAALQLERHRHLAPSAVLLQDWCLHYRFARVFAVRVGDDELFDALHEGLRRLHAEGRLRSILAQDAQIGPLLDGRRQLPPRRFEIPNPEWTEVYRAIPEGLFFKPR
jgi:hypothetical protein